MIRAALITVSTSRANGNAGAEAAGPDLSGERLAALARAVPAEVVGSEILPDDQARLTERLRYWSEPGRADLVLTSGGTGFSPSDVTPEATASVIERTAPGLAEAIRQVAAAHTQKWPLSRGVAGMRGRTLIINLPGNPRSIDESAPALLPVLPHAIQLLRGEDPAHD